MTRALPAERAPKPKPEPVGTFSLERRLYHYEPNPAKGQPGEPSHLVVNDGVELVIFGLSVDMDQLAQFVGRRAAGSKGGRSAIQGGLVVARVLSRGMKGGAA